MFRFFIERLRLPQNVTKVTPTISFLWHVGCRKASSSRAQSPPSIPAPDPEKLPIVSYLVGSCGLSSTAALAAAKFVSNKNKERCLSVIRLLKSYGFSDAQIDSIAITRSQQLISRIETSIKPKLDFLLSEGFSKEEAAEILSANPTLFARHVERGLAATLRFLTSVIPARSDVIRALKCGNQCLTAQREPHIKILRDNGVSESIIMYILGRYPMALMRSTDHLEEAAKKLIEGGLDPTSKMFGVALGHLSYISKEKWLRKVKLWQELGWSEDEVFDIFKKQPTSIFMSDEQVRFRVNFFQKSIGWDRAFITTNPSVLQLSVEKRIIPRVSVLKLLMSKGLIKKKWTQFQFYCSEEKFIEKYVKKYVSVVPEIVQTYRAPKDEQRSD